MKLKKITSLLMLYSMLVMTVTGILLFIAPPGRIANWANWEIFSISKGLAADIHTAFMVLFILFAILHIIYNIKPMTSYMKNQIKRFVFFTSENNVAILITILFIFGTGYSIAPFSTFIDFGEGIKNSWEKEYGTAPYSHAELSSLKSFTKKVGFDLEKSKEILVKNNIVFDIEQSLSQIGKENSVSPSFIYNILKKNFEKEGVKVLPLTGLGRKSIEEVAQTLQISTDDFIGKLKAIGVEASKDDKFKEVAENYDLSPMDVLTKLGYKKEE